MTDHVAILFKRYIELILEGRKTIESRLTKTRKRPYRRITPGDRIYLKCSSGPYMAKAVAGDVRFLDGLTPRRVAALRRELNHKICGDPAYWRLKSPSRYGSLIDLCQVEPTDRGPCLGPSQGMAWFILDGSA